MFIGTGNSMKCNGRPSWKTINSHGVKFPGLNGQEITEERFGLSFVLGFPYTGGKNPHIYLYMYITESALDNGYIHVAWLWCGCLLPPAPSVPAAEGMLSTRFTGGCSPHSLLVVQPLCTLHATSRIGSCYYETGAEVKQMALKRCFKKPRFHQHA